MNVYDSARIVDVLAPLGFEAANSAAEADLVIFNTCHIREKAAEKLYSELGRLKAERDREGSATQSALIAVAGCVAQAEGEEVFGRAPFVDIVVGPQTYHRLPELVVRASRERGRLLDTDFPSVPKFDHLPEATSTQTPGTAFLTVQEGCDKFCTFCVVPYTRGAEYSRPPAAVLAEARHLARIGAKEVTLLGQNVSGYRALGADGTGWGLGRLIRALADIQGLTRLRYTTSYPAEVDAELVSAHRDVPQLMPFLHLPVQSGSNRVLKAMNRRHTADDYCRLVDRLRAARPDLALSSDFIVGFPGETDADFAATLTLVERVGFAQAYSFKYSPRPGTPAALLPQLPEPVKAERLAALQALLDRQRWAFNAAFVGRTVEVLFDRPGRHPNQFLGRSPFMQAVHADATDDSLGTVQPVRITSAGANSLGGDVITEAAV